MDIRARAQLAARAHHRRGHISLHLQFVDIATRTWWKGPYGGGGGGVLIDGYGPDGTEWQGSGYGGGGSGFSGVASGLPGWCHTHRGQLDTYNNEQRRYDVTGPFYITHFYTIL